MNFELNLWSLILIFGAVQGLLLAPIIFFQKKGSPTSNKLLSLFVIVLSILLLDYSARLSHLYKIAPSLLYISDSLWYLIGPILYLYTTFHLGKKVFRISDFLHSIPFILAFIYFFPLFTSSGEQKIKVLELYYQNGAQYSFINEILIVLMMGQILTYIWFSYLSLKKYEESFKDLFSNNHIQFLTDTKLVCLVFFIYFFFEFSFSTYRNFLNIENSFIENWSLVVWSFFLYSLSYVHLKHRTIIYPELERRIDSSNNTYSEIANEEMVEKLKELMETEKPYLENELRLSVLAEILGITTHQLSYLINQKIGVNFYEFVNTYRIKEAKNRIGKPEYEHLTIEGIANETGFKSKSSFYKFFKNEFGVTPSEYLEKSNK